MIKTFSLLALLVASTVWAESAGGLSWKSPTGWKTDGPRPMRAATYKVPAAKGDSEEAECAVFYFGQGQGGGIDENLKRWAGQFEGNPAVTPKKETIGGLPAHIVEFSGTYTGGGGMMGPKTSKPGYKLLGAIVEGPNGPVFFKFTGPAKTVDGAKADFMKLLKGISK